MPTCRIPRVAVQVVRRLPGSCRRREDRGTTDPLIRSERDLQWVPMRSITIGWNQSSLCELVPSLEALGCCDTSIASNRQEGVESCDGVTKGDLKSRGGGGQGSDCKARLNP